LRIKREEFSSSSKGVVSKEEGITEYKRNLLSESLIRRNLEKRPEAPRGGL